MIAQNDRHVALTGPETARAKCPICEEVRRSYLFVVRGLPVVRCPGCGLVCLHPQPSREECKEFYRLETAEDEAARHSIPTTTEQDALSRYLGALHECGLHGGRILLIAPPDYPCAADISAAGFDVDTHRSLADGGEVEDFGRDYDAVIVLHELEKAASPTDLLKAVRASLRPAGVLLLTASSIDSWPAGFFGERWIQWRPENRFYFSPTTIQLLLLKSGFANIWVEPDRRRYTLAHIHDRAKNSPRTFWTRAIHALYRIVPASLRQMHVRLATSGMIVTAVKVEKRRRPLCSIIVPAYNERETFPLLMNALLAQRLQGVDREIIIVESNSSDGTRDLALQYRNYPEVRVVLEDRPRGKGHAVRAGLAHATGDFVLIQDADLEYDLNDYELLLEPLLASRALFVLGARHGGNWKMRHFTDQPAMSSALNVGHLFFTTLLNVLFRQCLKDPFTMFKVLHRDCLHGLKFTCNRFDFDHELVIKLVRKGYTPLEIPVNYRSRSFKEGKKVSMLRDPLSWIWVNFKLRFTPLRRRSAQ